LSTTFRSKYVLCKPLQLIVKPLTLIQIVNEVLSSNIEDTGGARVVQLADSYDLLPNWGPNAAPEGKEPTIATTWQSPFIGKPLVEVATWIQHIPKPPKPINKTYFAVLQKELYEQNKQALVCRVRGNGRRVETIPIDAQSIGGFQWLFRRPDWYWCHKEQEV
jgi:hypothetical protein